MTETSIGLVHGQTETAAHLLQKLVAAGLVIKAYDALPDLIRTLADHLALSAKTPPVSNYTDAERLLDRLVKADLVVRPQASKRLIAMIGTVISNTIDSQRIRSQ